MFKGREEVRRPKRFTNIVLNTYHASTPKSPLQIRFIRKKLTISVISMQADSSITKSMNFFLVLLLLQYKRGGRRTAAGRRSISWTPVWVGQQCSTEVGGGSGKAFGMGRAWRGRGHVTATVGEIVAKWQPHGQVPAQLHISIFHPSYCSPSHLLAPH